MSEIADKISEETRAKIRKENRNRKARLYGSVAGLAASETRRLPGLAAEAIGQLGEIGEKPFDEALHGLRLGLVDPKRALDGSKIRKAVGAPSVPIYAAEIDSALSPQVIDLVEKLRALKVPGVPQGAKVSPYITAGSDGLAGLAHEIGHTVKSPIVAASFISQNPIVKMLGLGAGMSAMMSDNETMQAVAPIISSAPHIPQLMEEARASTHAVRGIHATKGLAEAARAGARLTPAFLTYVAGALPALFAPYVAKAVKEYINSDPKPSMSSEPEKSAADQGYQPKATNKLKQTARVAWAPPAPKPQVSKIGKPGIDPAPPPSKAKFYRDMQRMFAGLGARRGS